MRGKLTPGHPPNCGSRVQRHSSISFAQHKCRTNSQAASLFNDRAASHPSPAIRAAFDDSKLTQKEKVGVLITRIDNFARYVYNPESLQIAS